MDRERLLEILNSEGSIKAGEIIIKRSHNKFVLLRGINSLFIAPKIDDIISHLNSQKFLVNYDDMTRSFFNKRVDIVSKNFIIDVCKRGVSNIQLVLLNELAKEEGTSLELFLFNNLYDFFSNNSVFGTTICNLNCFIWNKIFKTNNEFLVQED